MKNVIKTFVAMAVMTALTVTAFAQGAGPGGGKGAAGGGKPGQGGPGAGGGMRRGPGMMMGMDGEVLAKLKLTKPQMDAIKKLKDDTKKKMDALRAGLPKPKDGERPKMDDATRTKMKGIFDGYTAGMKKTMGDAKFAEYQKLMKAAMEKMREKGGFGGGRPGGPGAAGAGAGAGAGKGKGKGGDKTGL